MENVRIGPVRVSQSLDATTLNEVQTTGRGLTSSAIATGVLWLCAGFAFILIDPVRGIQSQERFYEAIVEHPFLYQLPRVLLSITGMIAIAAVTAISWRIGTVGSAWRSWSVMVAIIGLSLTAISQLRFALINPERALIFVNGDMAVRSSIEAARFTLQLDYGGLIGTLSFAQWLLAFNVLAFKSRSWPSAICSLGFLVVGVTVIGLTSRGLDLAAFVGLTSLVNAVFAPAWFIWIGIWHRINSRTPGIS